MTKLNAVGETVTVAGSFSDADVGTLPSPHANSVIAAMAADRARATPAALTLRFGMVVSPVDGSELQRNPLHVALLLIQRRNTLPLTGC